MPERILAAIVAILLAAFGIFSLRARAQDETEEIKSVSGHGLFVTTFLMLFLAEMGDKTQLAVAGLTGTLPAVSVWIGATLALATISALGAWRLRRTATTRAHPPASGASDQRTLFPVFRGFRADQGLLIVVDRDCARDRQPHERLRIRPLDVWLHQLFRMTLDGRRRAPLRH